MSRSTLIALLALVVVSGCGDEEPTTVGSSSTSAASGGGGGGGVGGETAAAGGAGGVGGDTSGSGGAGGMSATLPLGTVTENPDCTVPAQAPAGTECKSLTVTCPDVPDEDVRVLLIPAVGTQRGTVVLGTGGLGTGFYNAQVVGALRQAGFRVANRAWATGWENGDPGGMARAACRYATLVTWLDEPSEPLCVTGNSGGSVEISYALSRYGRDAIIDLAVPTGGPPMGRLDHGCVGDAAWLTECDALTSGTACAGSVQCIYNDSNRAIIDAAYAGTPCADEDATMAATWEADSVLSPDAQLAYPNTPVRFIFGTQDCTSALPLGLVYANAVTSETTISYVDAPHATFSTAAGRAAIVNAIDSECGN